MQGHQADRTPAVEPIDERKKGVATGGSPRSAAPWTEHHPFFGRGRQIEGVRIDRPMIWPKFRATLADRNRAVTAVAGYDGGA